MDDRTLLERAAKAAGLEDAELQDMEGWGEIRYGYSCAIWSKALFEADGSGYWNPLEDDGDTFRMAARLNLFDSPAFRHFLALERFSGQEHDDLRAHRRAFTRAAAALAKEPS